jgi:hypothetical protein
MDPHAGVVLEVHRRRLDDLRRHLLGSGASVFSAHHNERWGEGWLPPELCTSADFRAMQIADLVCAVIGSPASGGVAVELGWASAMRRPVLMIMPANAACTPLIKGLGCVTLVKCLVEPPVWHSAFYRAACMAIADLSATLDRRAIEPDSAYARGFVSEDVQ